MNINARVVNINVCTIRSSRTVCVHIMEITAVEYFVTFKPQKQRYFIVKCTVSEFCLLKLPKVILFIHVLFENIH